MHEVRQGSEPRGRHEAAPARGAHERTAGPRHAAPPSRAWAARTALALAAATALGLLGSVPVVRSSAADAARSVGSAITGDRSGVEADAAGPIGAFLPGEEDDADVPVEPGASTGGETGGDAGGSSTPQVVAASLPGQSDPAAVPAFVTWFPAVDANGVPQPSTGTTGDASAPVVLPPVPTEFTPSPLPFPTGDPSPTFSTEPTPSMTPSFDPTTPGPTPSSGGSTGPATSSAPPADTEAALRYSPPALIDPVVIAFPEGESRVTLDTSRDYILTLPQDRPLVNTLGLTIVGGRNIVIIGGTVDVRDGVAGVRRGMYLKDATPTGTTYVEGVRFLSSTTGALTEGIDIASPGARVVLQNIAITGALSGSYATNHADVVQSWAGPRVLLVDGLSASSRYQGFFLLPNQHDSSRVDDWSINRVSLSGVQSAYLLWRDGGTFAIRTQDVYVTGSRYAGGGLWPSASDWPDVTLGPAPETYGVTAGLGYRSPGYR